MTLDSLLGEFSIGNDTAATAALKTTMSTKLHSEMGYRQPGRSWQTLRYILLDPNTGAGAYRIGGGENGGNIYSLFGSALAIVFGLFFIGLGPMGTLLGFTLIYFSIMLFVIETLNFASAGLVDWSIPGLVMVLSPFLAVGVSAVALEQAIAALIGFIVWVIANEHS